MREKIAEFPGGTSSRVIEKMSEMAVLKNADLVFTQHN